MSWNAFFTTLCVSQGFFKRICNYHICYFCKNKSFRLNCSATFIGRNLWSQMTAYWHYWKQDLKNGNGILRSIWRRNQKLTKLLGFLGSICVFANSFSYPLPLRRVWNYHEINWRRFHPKRSRQDTLLSTIQKQNINYKCFAWHAALKRLIDPSKMNQAR